MTLAQQFVQKISAIIAGAIAFTIPWLAIDPYTLILDMASERTVVSVVACLVVALIFDSAVYHLALFRQGREGKGSKKPKHSSNDEDYKTAYLCPSCGQTFAKPVRIMDPKTEQFLYSVCPKCAKPLIQQVFQPAQPMPPAPLPIAVPAPPPVDPALVARSMGVPEKPIAAAEPKKPRLELKPDGTIVVYPGE